ncbi:TRAFAC clade GTPase domain-containing protein [Singulisphaera sp. PoT]|uniref:TRAFAC clade GTPase domain-containing protein n=1 Tax=Singulisphaera sp. PoT TaxID=3411797 RepID=UPI003BF5C3AB
MVPDPIFSRTAHGRRTVGAGLKTPWWIVPIEDRSRAWKRHLDRLLLPNSLPCRECGQPADYRLCPSCHRHLPDSAVTLRSAQVVVVGPESVGKTTFLSVLINELDNHVGPDLGFVLSTVTDETRERYARDYHDQTYGLSDLGVGDERARRHSHAPTLSLKVDRSILDPLVFQGNRAKRSGAILSFFDTSGEDWEENLDLLRNEAEYVGRAKGLLFLIDPLRLRAVAHDPRLHLTEKERRVPLADYLNDIRKLATFFPNTPTKTPLAIVLNKLDRWGRLLPKGTKLYEWACGVPESRPSLGLDQAIHDEVQSALRHWGATGFLEHLDVHFPNHRCFACSTLGDAAQDRDDEPQPLPTPLLVERPVLWLLRKQKVMDQLESRRPGPR